MITWLKDTSRGMLHLVYPNICLSCGDTLAKQETNICLSCQQSLVPTSFWKYDNNPVQEIFEGRVQVNKAFAFYYLEKKSVLHAIMHDIKYNGNKNAAIWMGNLIGEALKKEDSGWNFIDAILPVPLHPKKLHERGYNQSLFIVKGIAEVMGIKFLDNTLIRNQYSMTQTRKNRIERWDNVSEIFSVAKHNNIQGKNVLLVDDVVTTGATAEACMQVLLDANCKTVNFAALAMAI